ncbi:MAG: hypothetical protein Q7T18_02215 [Sedimentisphaerales bacterium]|nr:hypothetical protein [Sedimentisphaerales bacterium]
MSTQENQVPQDMEKLKEIPKWTRTYAQNRMLTFLVTLVISLFFSLSISGLSRLCGAALRAGNVVLGLVSVVMVFALLIGLLIFSIPKLGGIKIWRWIDRRIYGQEGIVSIPEPELMKKKKWIGYVVGMLFGLCVMGSVFLGGRGYFTLKYMQPISAIYLVPFTTFLYFWQRPKVGPLMLLWPILYTIHALLIVVGVPIVFSEESRLFFLNMFIPTFGYGFLTFVIGHIYSRYALKKLKATALLQENKNE